MATRGGMLVIRALASDTLAIVGAVNTVSNGFQLASRIFQSTGESDF
jgi:hypothetical protein